MLYYNTSNGLIFQQSKELRTTIIDPRANFLDHTGHLIALGGTVGQKSLCLTIQVGTIFGRGDPRIDRNLSHWSRDRFLSFLNENGMRSDPMPLDFPVPKPAPSRLVAHALLFSIVT